MAWEWTPEHGWIDRMEPAVPIAPTGIAASAITSADHTQLRPVCGFNVDRTGDWPAPEGALNEDGSPAGQRRKLCPGRHADAGATRGLPDQGSTAGRSGDS